MKNSCQQVGTKENKNRSLSVTLNLFQGLTRCRNKFGMTVQGDFQVKKIVTVIYFLTTLFLFSIAFATDSIMVHDAWVRSAPPNAKVLAAYMIIVNKSGEPRKLTAVSSSRFDKVEMHKTEMHGEMMKMIPQKELEILPGGTLVLEPGGYHLMLMEPKSVPQEGEEVDIELHFDNGQTLHISVPVRAGSTKGMAGEHRH
jgi:copper(I)-binding protein